MDKEVTAKPQKLSLFGRMIAKLLPAAKGPYVDTKRPYVDTKRFAPLERPNHWRDLKELNAFNESKYIPAGQYRNVKGV